MYIRFDLVKVLTHAKVTREFGKKTRTVDHILHQIRDYCPCAMFRHSCDYLYSHD